MRCLFAVQMNLTNREDLDVIVAALRAADATWYEVTVRPFRDTFGGEPSPGFFASHFTVPLGTVMFMRKAMRLGWKGVLHDPELFNYEAYVAHYGEAMLNADGRAHSLRGVPDFTGDRFIRPVADDKSFTGEVVNGGALASWKRFTVQANAHAKRTTRVWVAEAKNIAAEYRFFVVDCVVRAGSLYHANGRRALARTGQEYEVWQYAQAQASQWGPHRAFVIDIAVLNDGTFRVIECGNLNAAGVYDADYVAVIQALQTAYA